MCLFNMSRNFVLFDPGLLYCFINLLTFVELQFMNAGPPMFLDICMGRAYHTLDPQALMKPFFNVLNVPYASAPVSANCA